MKGLKIGVLAVVFWGLSIGAVADPDKPRVFQTAPVINGASGLEEGAGIGSQVSPAPPFVKFFGRVLKKNNARCSEIHLDIQVHVMDTDWVSELRYPENLQSFAVFPPAPDCK